MSKKKRDHVEVLLFIFLIFSHFILVRLWHFVSVHPEALNIFDIYFFGSNPYCISDVTMSAAMANRHYRF